MNIPCSQIKPPLKKLEKNYTTLSIYCLLMIGCWALQELFIYPYWRFKNWLFGLNILCIIVNICFLLASFKNPGRVQKNKKLKFEKLVEKCDPNGLCPNCETIYTKDSRHCYICNQCINKFDHHCQWINNCVGKDNHYVFYAYILQLLIYFFICAVLCFMNMGSENQLTVDDLKNSTFDPLGLNRESGLLVFDSIWSSSNPSS